jgi:hypothetical protein
MKVVKMVNLNENFVIDKDGNRIGVFLDIKAYNLLIAELEELDDIRAYDAAKSANDEVISFDHAVKEIEQDHLK